MKMNLSMIALITFLPVAVVLSASEPPQAVETFVANVVSFSSAQGAVTDTLTLRVESWTSVKEAQVLFGVLGQKGMETFHKAINEQDRGSLASEGRIGWPINVAIENRTPEGRFIRLILERPTLGDELSRLDRSADFPFVVVEFTLGGDGKGTGRVVPAAKLRLSPKGDLEILPYQEPDEQKIIAVRMIEQ